MSTVVTDFAEIYWGKSTSVRKDEELPAPSVCLHINVFADPLMSKPVPFTLPSFADFASVTHLSFANLGMTTDFFLKEVCPVLASLPRLTSLCLANNHLTAPALTAIADLVVPPPVYESLVAPIVNDVSFFPVKTDGVVSTCLLSASRGATNPLAHWHTLNTALLVDRAAVPRPGSGCTCGSTHRVPPLAWLDLSHNPLFGARAPHTPAGDTSAPVGVSVGVVGDNTDTVADEDTSDDEWAMRLFPRRSRPAPPSAAERVAALMAPLAGVGLGAGVSLDGMAEDASQGAPDAARDPVLAALASLPALNTHARTWTHVNVEEQAAAVEARTRAATALLRLLSAVSAGGRGGAGMASADAARGCCAARAALEADASRHRTAHARVLQDADMEEAEEAGEEWGPLHAIAEEEAEVDEGEGEDGDAISGGSGARQARAVATAATAPCSGRACLSAAAAVVLAHAPPHASPLRAIALTDTALPPALATLLASYARALAHLPAPRALTTLALTQDAVTRFPLPVSVSALPSDAAPAPTNSPPQWVAGACSPVLPQAVRAYTSSASGPAAPVFAAAEDAVAQLAHASHPLSHPTASAAVCAVGVLVAASAAPPRVGTVRPPPPVAQKSASASHSTNTTSSSWARPFSASSQAPTSTHTTVSPPSPASPATLAAEDAAVDPLLAAFLAAVQPDVSPSRAHPSRAHTPTRSRSSHAHAQVKAQTQTRPLLPQPSPAAATAAAPRARTLLVYAPDEDVLADDMPNSSLLYPCPHNPPSPPPSTLLSYRSLPSRDLRPSSQRSRRAASPATPPAAVQCALAALYADLDGADDLDALSGWGSGLDAFTVGSSPAPAPVSRSRVVLGAHTTALAHTTASACASVSAAVQVPLQPSQSSQSSPQPQKLEQLPQPPREAVLPSRSGPARPWPTSAAVPVSSVVPSVVSPATIRPLPRAPGSSRPPASPLASREPPRSLDTQRSVMPHAPSRTGVGFIRQARPPSAALTPQSAAASSTRNSPPTPLPTASQSVPPRLSHASQAPSLSPTSTVADSSVPRSLRERAPPPALALAPGMVSQRMPSMAGSTQSTRVRAVMPSHITTFDPNAAPLRAPDPAPTIQTRQSRSVSRLPVSGTPPLSMKKTNTHISSD